MMDGLAFLPVENVTDGMAYLREIVPEGLQDLLEYFDSTYVTGTFRRVQQHPTRDGLLPPAPARIRRIPPRFPPATWNVHEVTLADEDRTNNVCEGWNNGFKTLVGHNHPSFWKAVESLRKDAALVATRIVQESHGQPPRKWVR